MLLNAESIAQGRIAHIPKSAGRDTTYFYTHQQQLCRKLGLPQVLDDTCNHHFRFWSDTRVVDVCKNGQDVTASLIRWTEEITPDNEPATGRVFKQIHSLDAIGLKIDSLIEHSGIKQVPDEYEIEGWHRGMDGITYMIEYADDSVYYFKSYWTPESQQHIKEGVVLKQFIENLMAIVETPDSRKQFEAGIPFQCWTNGGISMACRVVTKNQARKYKRERNRYRKNIL